MKRRFGKKLFNLGWLRSFFPRSLKFPVSFPTTDWEIILADNKLEENRCQIMWRITTIAILVSATFYSPDIRLLKLGRGTPSIVWSVRDLE